MKKVFSILAVVALVAVFSVSCSKVCKCYDSAGTLVTEYPDNVDKAQCDLANTAIKIVGGKCAME